MNVILEPETEQWIVKEAQRAEISPERYLAERLRKDHEILRQFPAAFGEEAQLLVQINEGFSDEFWARYRALITRREAHALTEPERIELIGLSDRVEAKNAERLPYLLALAQRRGYLCQS